jgi:hypothetical protein
MLEAMSLALLLVTALAVALFVRGILARRARQPEVAKDTTPAMDRFIVETLELELAPKVVGQRSSTPEERTRLARTLRGDDPDPDVVSRIEETVKAVELEFVRYAHEADAELSVRVRYENGESAAASKRIAWGDLPEAIRADFERRSASRVFRTWAFPWDRVHAA